MLWLTSHLTHCHMEAATPGMHKKRRACGCRAAQGGWASLCSGSGSGRPRHALRLGGLAHEAQHRRARPVRRGVDFDDPVLGGLRPAKGGNSFPTGQWQTATVEQCLLSSPWERLARAGTSRGSWDWDSSSQRLITDYPISGLEAGA